MVPNRWRRRPKAVVSLRVAWWVILSTTVSAIGCSKEKIDNLVASAKEKSAQIAEGAKESAASMKEQVADAAGGVTDQAERTMDKVSELLPGSGTVTLILDNPVTFHRAELQIVRVDEKRPIVLQVTSYQRDRPIEDYPCLMMRAMTSLSTETFTDAMPWLGIPLPCRVFVQLEAGGPIWATEMSAPIQLTLTHDPSKPDMVAGKLGAGTLVAPDGKTLSMAAGEMTAGFSPVIGGTL